ncbi:MAG: phosphoglycolate phosphatase [Alphaproteobacteria bacterium]|nr:phosphoglycolate phosphatase [Alphaproteobacteria bacterium]
MASPAVLIDLDGTLVDTAPDLLGALNAVLTSERRSTVDPQTLRHMVGHGARALIERAMSATGEPVAAEQLPGLVDRFIAYYREHIADGSQPFPEVDETLSRLRESGARLAVLTNKPQVLTEPILAALGLARHFDVICGSGRYAFNKPDGRIVAHVVQELGGMEGGAIMIGDSAVDVATARAAAIPVALLSYGYTPEPVHNLGADAIVDCFSEVPAVLRKLLRSDT